MKLLGPFFPIAVLLLVFASCKKDEPVQPYVPSIQLAVEDASCTEAWLKVSSTQVPANVRLLRDGQRSFDLRLLASDSLVIDEGLLPRHTYTYQLQKLNTDSSVSETSASVQLTTMDTTSHNFTWEIDTLGVTASTLYDVAIINDTLAYAVGEMYLRDSTGQIDPNAYNMAKWNGVSWQLMRIQFYTICGQQSRTPYPASSIFAFSETDIWISSRGGQLARWNGPTQAETICNPDPFVINKLWGERPNSIWAVGYGGRIGHYTSGTWRRVESGTTVILNDVWGGSNRRVGENVVLVPAGNKYTAGETKLLRIGRAGVVDTLPWAMPTRTRQSIWFDHHTKVYTCGSGVFTDNGNGWRLANGIPAIYSNCMRGNGENDIIVVGDFGLLAHFNGFTWRLFSEVGLPKGNYESVVMKGNLMFAVGWTGNRAVALHSMRQ